MMLSRILAALATAALLPVSALAQATVAVPLQEFGPPPARRSTTYGSDVAISGDTLAIAQQDGFGSVFGSPGVVDLFVFDGTEWRYQATVTSSHQLNRDRFGLAVHLDGDTLVVGAPASSITATSRVYVFERSGTTWTETAVLEDTATEVWTHFGWAVHVAGDTLMIGAPAEDDAVGVDTGAAYVFTRVGSTWTLQARLTASDSQPGWSFGRSIDRDGTTAIIGSVYDTAVAPRRTSGSAYVFTDSGAQWTEEAILDPSVRDPDDHFAWSVSVSGDTAVVGAYSPPGVDGRAFVYERSGSNWSEVQMLLGNGASPLPTLFGYAVHVEGDQLVVGAHSDDEAATNVGAVYRYYHSGGQWLVQEKLVPADPVGTDFFGYELELTDDRLLVSAPSFGALGNRGQAHLFSIFAAASVANRSSPPNPDSYTAGPPVIGALWNGTVDLTTTGHTLARVLGMTQPASVVLGGGQVPLIGGAPVFALVAIHGPLASFAKTIPNELVLVGLTVYSQAIHFGSVTPFALSNAQDFIIGL